LSFIDATTVLPPQDERSRITILFQFCFKFLTYMPNEH